MRRLRPDEQSALNVLANRESICLGPVTSAEGQRLAIALSGLAKLRLALAEETDDGPRYTLSPDGEAHLSKL